MSKFFGIFILILFFSLTAEAKQTNTLNPAINKQKEGEDINKQFTADCCDKNTRWKAFKRINKFAVLYL